MATATKFAPSKVPGEAPSPIINLEGHQSDLARRQAERDARRAEMRRCLNPVYAGKKEAAKPLWRWTVSAEWLGIHDEQQTILKSEQVVVAQTEADAWSAFCDRVGHWPSRRESKPVIKRGKQVDIGSVADDEADYEGELPIVEVGALPKKKR